MQFLQENPGLLALAIFLMRVLDVSMGTFRTIMVVRGYRSLAPVIAFFEVLIWIVAVSQVMKNLHEWYLAVAYAGGFAAGNYLGMWIDRKLALGSELVRAISANPDVRLARALRSGHDVTELSGKSRDTPVEVLLVVERRKRIPELLRQIRAEDPDAICTLSDVRQAPPSAQRKAGVFASLRSLGKRK